MRILRVMGSFQIRSGMYDENGCTVSLKNGHTSWGLSTERRLLMTAVLSVL